MAKPQINSDGRTITVRVPVSIRKRGGRKVVLAPDGSRHEPGTLRCQQIDNAMVKALARAFRWREMLETSQYASIVEIAAAERINESYISRLLRLTLLAPDVIETILAGRQVSTITLASLMRRPPIRWKDQRAFIGTLRTEQAGCDLKTS
jgi:hypothetical protein